jgi:hypothetical protein
MIVKFKPTISVANNGITPILNTTAWGYNVVPTSTLIGKNRGAAGQLTNLWLVVPYILCTAQNVTLTFQTLINGAWASAIDVPTGYLGGGNTITANASAQAGFSWRLYGDSNVFITNGGTGPTILDLGTPYLTDIDPKGNP